MQLVELLKRANTGFNDGFLSEYFNEETGEYNPDGKGDTLAQFVVIEISETFDKDATDDNQLHEARHQMGNAIRDLQGVIDVL